MSTFKVRCQFKCHFLNVMHKNNLSNVLKISGYASILDQLSTHATTNHMKQCQYFKIKTTFYHSPSQTLNIFLNKYVSIWKSISNMIPWVRPKDDLDLKPIQRLTRTHGNTHISTLAYVTLYESLKALTIHHGLQGFCSFYVKIQIHEFF